MVVLSLEARSGKVVGSESGVEGGVISLLRLRGEVLEGEGGLVDAGVRVVEAMLDAVSRVIEKILEASGRKCYSCTSGVLLSLRWRYTLGDLYTL